MPGSHSLSRRATLALLATSVHIEPDPVRLRASLSASNLDWQDVFYCADGHGLTPMLYSLARKHELFHLIAEPAQQYLEQAYNDNRTRNVDARREFAEIMSCMAWAGVEVLVLKGLPLLLDLYPDPADRVLYDLDLLAREAAEAQRGLELLLNAGFTPVPMKAGTLVNKHLPSVWRMNGFVRRGYLFDPKQPRPVELHVRLWDPEWRGLDVRSLDDLWSRSRVKEFDGISICIMSPEDTFVHLCVHLATHLVEREARLGQAVDVARFLQRYDQALDWDKIIEAGERARVLRFLYLTLVTVNQLTDAPLPDARVLAALRADTPTRLRKWAEQGGASDLLAMDYRETQLDRAYALTFAAAETWREKLSVLRFALFPPLDQLEHEYGMRSRVLYARHLAGRGRRYLNSLWGHSAREN